MCNSDRLLYAASPAPLAAGGRSSAALWPEESVPPPPSAQTAASAGDTCRKNWMRLRVI